MEERILVVAKDILDAQLIFGFLNQAKKEKKIGDFAFKGVSEEDFRLKEDVERFRPTKMIIVAVNDGAYGAIAMYREIPYIYIIPQKGFIFLFGRKGNHSRKVVLKIDEEDKNKIKEELIPLLIFFFS